MPDPTAKGPRLRLRKRAGREPRYYIRDTHGPERSTGTGDRLEAEKALAAYLQEQHYQPAAAATDRITVVEALALYGEQHAPHTASPERIAYAIQSLIPFWRDVLLRDVTAGACRRYAVDRGSAQGAYAGHKAVAQSTVRRELGTLQAAIRHAHREGYVTTAPLVTMPGKPRPRNRWLTRNEVAWLLRGARPNPHLARFILIAVKTGTRKRAVLDLEWTPSMQNGWLDTATGIMHREGAEARQTKKRKPVTRMPATLLAHAQRWQRDGARFVCHRHGNRVVSIKRSWASAIQRAEQLARRAGVDLDLTGVTPHTLKHTAVTWAMQRGVPISDAAGFFGTTAAELERTYLHHHPDFMKATAAAMDRKA